VDTLFEKNKPDLQPVCSDCRSTSLEEQPSCLAKTFS